MAFSKVLRAGLIVASLVWVCGVGAGLYLLLRYENSPGEKIAAPTEWPDESRIPRRAGHATLVMLAHPHCPCTRASLWELAELMAHDQGKVDAYVILSHPAGMPDNWEKTDLWYSAAQIPGVKVLSDPEAAEARRFRAVTSGSTILYNAEGHLMFEGGITGGRGHAGDNAGQSALIALLNSGKAPVAETPVFGCPIFTPGSTAVNEACPMKGDAPEQTSATTEP